MRTLRDYAYSTIKPLIEWGISVFNPGDTVSKVLGELIEAGRYEAIVVSGRKMGVVTLRDFLDVVQPSRRKLEGMWRITGAAHVDDRVIDVAERLGREGLRALPVVGGESIGLISHVDLAKGLCDVSELSAFKAGEVMTTPIHTLSVEEEVSKARRMMLEMGFSHIPIVEDGELRGIVTARMLVEDFIAPLSRATVGERIGERIARMEGAVRDVMDRHPLTAHREASLLEVAEDMTRMERSACIVVEGRRPIGIITPMELLKPLLRLRPERRLPLYIMGLGDEDFYERSLVEEKLRRVVERGMRIHPWIREASVRVKKTGERGGRTRYEVKARVMGLSESISAEASGWDLLRVFDELAERLDKALRRSKPETGRRRRRR